MVHAVMAEAQPGDVLVLTMPEPEPVALLGDLLATQARARGVAGVLVDAAVRDADELRRDGAAGVGALGARAGRAQGGARARSTSRWWSAARGSARATSSCSTATAPAWSSGRGSTRCSPRPRRARSASGSSAARLQAGELSYDIDGLRRVNARATSTTSSCSPRSPARASAFFVDVLGMEVESRAGQSVFLRGWGEYQPYSAQADRGGDLRPRPHGVPHGERRGARATRRGDRGSAGEWIDGDHGHGPAYRFTDPDGHVMEVLWETERYEPPEASPSWRNQPQRYTGRGAAVKRLDHVNLLASDVAPAASSRPTSSATATTRASCSTTAARPAPG